MKKTLLMLGALAALLMFAGCSNGSKDSSDEPYTIKEEIGYMYDQSQGPGSGFPQNSEGKYFGYMYYLTATTNSTYKDCIGKDIFYKVGESGCGNLYHKQCKEKVLKMLEDGKFEEFSPDWLGYKTIIIAKEPE